MAKHETVTLASNRPTPPTEVAPETPKPEATPTAPPSQALTPEQVAAYIAANPGVLSQVAAAPVPPDYSVKHSVEGTVLTVKGFNWTLTVDMAKDQGLSSTGKSTLICSTHGNLDLGDGLKLGVNCYRMLPKRSARR